ncbi:hypothetical protein JW988_05330 [Candidatus Bathyarchaeota archaeon]|nr:hypothetical protein [Candidatus Bathyarchaeota archaeon]
MKRKALALTITLLFTIVAGMQFVDSTLANPNPLYYPSTPDRNSPSIKIETPQQNKKYNLTTVPYSITIDTSTFKNNSVHSLLSIGYIIDGRERVTISDNPNRQSQILSLEGNLSGLSEGSHTIQAWVKSVSYYRPSDTQTTAEFSLITYSDITHFTTYLIPSVFILSVENKKYASSDVPLNFTANKPVAKVSYSLDGLDNVTITGSTTLTSLPFGKHNITVYVTDYFGNIGKSETLFFTIEEPFPTLLVATVSVIIVVCLCTVFLLLRKHKH